MTVRGIGLSIYSPLRLVIQGLPRCVSRSTLHKGMTLEFTYLNCSILTLLLTRKMKPRDNLGYSAQCLHILQAEAPERCQGLYYMATAVWLSEKAARLERLQCLTAQLPEYQHREPGHFVTTQERIRFNTA